jgi:type VI secretion system protein ImpG
MDRASPLLDEALLVSLFPGQLQPIPSCAVFQLAGDTPRNAMLSARGADGRDYRFRLTSAAAGCATEVLALQWRPYAGPGKEHLLSVSITVTGPGSDIGPSASPGPGAGAGSRLGAQRLRLYVHAEPVLRAALLDALLMHASAAWVSAGDGALKPLLRVPLGPAAMGETGEYGWQVLREYQCFPERFNFIDLDLAAILRHLPPGADTVTLHLALPLRADCELAKTLSRVDGAKLLTGCAPAANLFVAAAAPVDIHGRASDYGLAPAKPSHLICSIDSVHLLRGRTLEVLRSPLSMSYGGVAAGTWTARRALPDEAGPPMRIAFTPAMAPHAVDAGAIASVELTCCDRAAPSGIVDVQPQGAAVSAVSRLREVEGGRALRWRLLGMLALETRPPDLESLRLAFSLQDLAGSDAAQKLQLALAGVQLVPATLRMRHRHGAVPIDGTEVRLRIDERALVGASVAMFVHVIDQYLSHSVHLNSFMQLVAISVESGEELMRCRPRNGKLIL